MQKVFNVAVDIGRKLPAPAFEVNTNDLKSVKLLITITNGQTLLDLTDTTVRIAIRKPDNNIIFQDCTVKDAKSGQVEIILENQAYIMAGTHTAEIMCYKGSDVVAVSGTFSYKSTKGIMNDEAVESKSEFTAINQKIEEAKKLLEDAAESGVDEQARKDIQQVTTQLADIGNVITDISTLKNVKASDGTIINVSVDESIKGKYKIVSSGFEDGYGVIKLNNGKYATRFHDQYNTWAKTLGKGLLVAHKGFNGWVDGTQTNGVYPENSLIAFEKAGEFGFQMIELDTLVTSDGKWVVSHETDTKNISGTLANINAITLADFKSRNLVKQYTNGGKYWTYSGDNLNYAPPTLAEVLQVCKKYNMYALVELKWIEPIYTDANYMELANIIKNAGMEEKVIIYGSLSTTMKAMKYLPNAIAGYSNIDTTDKDRVSQMRAYKNHMLSIGTTALTETMKTFVKENNVPLAVWTIDDYKTAESLFESGVDFVLTNTLIKNKEINSMTKFIGHDKNSLISDIPVTGTGTFSQDATTGELSFSSNTYYAKLLTLKPTDVKIGDIIKIKATGKTVTSTNGNVGKILIGNDKALPNKREKLVTFPDNTYKTKEIFYVVNDASENIYAYVGIVGSSGESEAKFKDVSIDVYTPMSLIANDNERFAYIWAYTGAFALRSGFANKGIKNITVDPADSSTLLVEYVPFGKSKGKPMVIANTVYYSDNYKRRVVPIIDDTANNIVKLKFFENDWTPVTDVSANMKMGFTLLIKNS